MGYEISAFILIELVQAQLDAAVAVMESIPELLEADAISGPQDLPAIRRCTSYIVLTRQVPPRTSPLIEAAAQPPRSTGR